MPRLAGRKGKTGIATTFINKNQSEQILLDLKHLLKVGRPAWLLAGWGGRRDLEARPGWLGRVLVAGLGVVAAGLTVYSSVLTTTVRWAGCACGA